MKATTRRILLSVAAAFAIVAVWIVLIWATSFNLVAEGPDTPTAQRIAAPFIWWSRALYFLGIEGLPRFVMFLLAPVAAFAVAIYGSLFVASRLGSSTLNDQLQ